MRRQTYSAREGGRMALPAGTRLGLYEILTPLGAGGMGEVYRAHDPRLKRDVALKVLPPDLASDPDRLERFEREAQTLAALNHPHIVTIFSVEEADDLHFLTMELVEGKTLTKVIPKGGLSLPHFFHIAIPLTEAISAAHEKGITHRDLKPGNVMVTEEDRIKVLDFGLAKLRHEAEVSEDSEAPTVPATDAGRVLGTAPYMSPEQVQGKAIDHRSDVFSLGIMLFEMVTGDRPFQGDTSAELASSILRDTPPSVTERKADLPRDLGKLIKHCLEKEPKKRYQSALDLANDLEELRREVDTGEAVASAGSPLSAKPADGKRRVWLFAGAVVVALALAVGYLQTRSPPEPPPAEAAAAERKMLVVLPFENLGAPENAYFAAGMTEEITSRLARVSGLGVISRTSAVQYDRTGKTTRQIGEDLGVGFVLEGTVRWDRRSEGAGRVRITPQLIRVADDTHVWADSYNRVLDDIFAAQSEIAQAVVDQLGVTLLPDERTSVEARPTTSMAAYQAYLRGLELLSDPDYPRESLELALQMFERAVELDPQFVAAHAQLGATHNVFWGVSYDRTPERLAKAREAAARALELDPDSADAHLTMGWHYRNQEELDRALQEFGAAAKLRPNDGGAAFAIGNVRRMQGRFGEAIGQFEKALQLDPRNAKYATELALTLRVLRRYSESIPYIDLAISLAPDQSEAYVMKMSTYECWGRLDEARATLEGAPRKDDRHYLIAWSGLEARQRKYQAALDRLAGGPELLEFYWGRYPRALLEAEIYHSMGEPRRARAAYDAARVVLEKIVEESPEDDEARMSLATAYAGLGRKAEAIQEAKSVVERHPVSADAWKGPELVWRLANIYVKVGEPEAAIDRLEYLLSIPSLVSVSGRLRFEPGLDPLRDHPRFKKLLTAGDRAEASR